MTPIRLPAVAAVLLGWILVPASYVRVAAGETRVFVEDGKALAVEERGGGWTRGSGFLQQRGTGKLLYGDRALGAGDFHVRVRLALEALEHTAASFVLGETSHLGLDGADRRLFAQGPLFGPTHYLSEAAGPIRPGEPFELEAARTGSELVIRLDGREVYRKEVGTDPLGLVGLRPWRATMRIYDFSAASTLVEPPATPEAPKSYTIPIVDISGDAARHRIVAAGTRKIYQGHPHTLLMPDGRTIHCVWTLEHGGFCGPLKRSTDGGNTWSELIEVPESWRSVRNCPTIHRLVDPGGTARLFVFAGNGAMYQSVSEDDGATWTPMTKNGLETVVAPMSVLPVEDGKRYLMWVQRRKPVGGGTRLTVWQAASTDGGLTWGDFREVVDVPGADPCEPGVIPSPDGRQLLMLMRENRRRLNSLCATSDDEGKTWSKARELPASLTGDRHAPRYAADGRLVIAFRDQADESPTKGHFVAWVGRYEDIVEGREGQYRVKLLHHYGRPGDCGYPGLELLPDGTLVATTYVDYEAGPERNSVVSVRFRLEETEARLAELPRKVVVFRSGTDGYHTYRIPALVVTTRGTLLAFCEGRKTGGGDHGDLDLVLKRSEDGGGTWGPQQLVHEEGGTAKITIGNPCPVVDRDTGTIWLPFCRDNDRVFVTHSEDDGRSWAEPREITADVKEPAWGWYATGPGHGIQLERGTHKGRLVVPCDIGDSKGWGDWAQKGRSLVIFSDDHGRTWRRGGITETSMNECEVVELADGSLLLSMRNYHGKERRAFAISRDGGATWSRPEHHDQVYCPTCQSSIQRFSLEPKNRILYSGPGGPGRKSLTIRATYDEGASWPVARILQQGPSAYSDLAVLPDGDVGCLYETGRSSAYETITFARFTLAWLEAARRSAETQRP